MRIVCLFTCLLLGGLGGSLVGQNLTASVNSLTFPSTNELTPVTLPLVLYNSTAQPIRIDTIKAYPTFGQTAFTFDFQPELIEAGDSARLELTFLPQHNIDYNEELLIQTDHGALAIDLKGQGVYANSYYASTQNLSEESLKQALKTRLNQGAVNLGYNGARDRMYMNIDNQRVNGRGASTNTIEGVYTGFKRTGYADRRAAQDQMNTEHTWPQALFGNDAGEMRRSDLFHIFPTKISANSKRANFPFGTVSSPSWQEGGSKFGQGVFEPRDAHKGLVARAMMYYVLRYNNQSSFLTGQEATLRSWHRAFLPDSIERRRNDDIFSFQRNRNPLIDYPQLLDRISSVATVSSAAAQIGFDVSVDTIALDTLVLGEIGTYDWILVNTGNQSLTIQALSLDHPAFSISEPGNLQVQPGDALRIPISFHSISEGLTEVQLQITFAYGDSLLIPISFFAQAPSSRGSLDPVVGDVYLDHRSEEIVLKLNQRQPFPAQAVLLSPSGKILKTMALHTQQQFYRLSIADLPRAYYTLWVQSERGTWVKKLEIRK